MNPAAKKDGQWECININQSTNQYYEWINSIYKILQYFLSTLLLLVLCDVFGLGYSLILRWILVS